MRFTANATDAVAVGFYVADVSFSAVDACAGTAVTTAC